MTHSPLPWNTADWEEDGGSNLTTIEYRYPAKEGGIWPDGIGHGKVAETYDGNNPIEDANYIVKAANNFPRAVKLLTELLTSLEISRPPGTHDSDGLIEESYDFLKEIEE